MNLIDKQLQWGFISELYENVRRDAVRQKLWNHKLEFALNKKHLLILMKFYRYFMKPWFCDTEFELIYTR